MWTNTQASQAKKPENFMKPVYTQQHSAQSPPSYLDQSNGTVSNCYPWAAWISAATYCPSCITQALHGCGSHSDGKIRQVANYKILGCPGTLRSGSTTTAPLGQVERLRFARTPVKLWRPPPIRWFCWNFFALACGDIIFSCYHLCSHSHA